MNRKPLPELVRLVANDKEWASFRRWTNQPKPTWGLTAEQKFPEVPHALADELFARLIDKLKRGELVAFGRWGERIDFVEIDAMHWSTMTYSIWFNELGYANGGRVGFSSIFAEVGAGPTPKISKPQTRTAVRAYFRDWVKTNPDAKISHRKMLSEVKAALGDNHHVTVNLFKQLWLDDFPGSHKFEGRPPK